MATLNDRNNTSGRLTAARTMRGSTVFNIALEEIGRIEDVIIEDPPGGLLSRSCSRAAFLGLAFIAIRCRGKPYDSSTEWTDTLSTTIVMYERARCPTPTGRPRHGTMRFEPKTFSRTTRASVLGIMS